MLPPRVAWHERQDMRAVSGDAPQYQTLSTTTARHKQSRSSFVSLVKARAVHPQLRVNRHRASFHSNNDERLSQTHIFSDAPL